MPTIEHLVTIGASAGGIEALSTVASGLPSDFAAAVCVVLHTAPDSPGMLSRILEKAGALPAVIASEGQKLEHGRLYVAPADRHLLIEPGKLAVRRGPKEHRFRPAVDPLFRSAAQVYGPRVIGVVLTGALDDGTAGLWTIKQLGGLAIVQDPADAQFPSMPAHAMQAIDVDYCVRIHDVAPLLVRLTSVAVHERAQSTPRSLGVEVAVTKGGGALEAGIEQLGEPSAIACPDCHGVLREWKEGGRWRFRCHTGHAFSAASLIEAIRESADQSLWATIRAMEEAGRLMRDLSRDADGDDADTQRLTDAATKAFDDARTLRAIVTATSREG